MHFGTRPTLICPLGARPLRNRVTLLTAPSAGISETGRSLTPSDCGSSMFPINYSTRLTMRFLCLTRSAVLPLLLVGLACARNNESNNTAATAQDTTNTAISDSARANQTESGMTDSTGQSTLGPGAEKTRPDQGQPVTSKGDTVNAGVDSSTTPR